MDLTVIICSYNRASSLFNTLVSLEQQALPAGRTWEVVVVNNNSSDRTEDVIGEFVRKGNLSLRYVFEKQQGLPYARNAGIKQAAGEILAFTDDDCITNSDWILSICNEFKSNPSVSGIGGRVELYDSRDKPVTIRPFKERIAFESTAQLFYLVPGCNMAFRREVFEAIGGFDPYSVPAKVWL